MLDRFNAAYEQMAQASAERARIRAFLEQTAQGELTLDRPATFDDLRFLAYAGMVHQTEFGLTVGKYVDGQGDFTIFNKASRNPSVDFDTSYPSLTSPQEVASKIFFHAHILTEAEMTICGSSIPRVILPSFMQTSGGDRGDIGIQGAEALDIHIPASAGGATSIMSPFGITIPVGFMRGVGTGITRWELESGSAWPKAIAMGTTDITESIGDVTRDKIIGVSHEDGRKDIRYFAFLSWNSINLLEQQGVTLADICFGQGLTRMGEIIGVQNLRVPILADNILHVLDSEVFSTVLKYRVKNRGMI